MQEGMEDLIGKIDELIGEAESELRRLRMAHGDLTSGRPRKERNGAADWLEGYLLSGPERASQLMLDAKQAGHTRKTIQRAAKELAIAKSGGPGSKWRLTKEVEHRKEGAAR